MAEPTDDSIDVTLADECKDQLLSNYLVVME